MSSDYEIYDTLNRMERAMDFLKSKNEITELLDKVTLIDQQLKRFESLGELIKHMKFLEKYIFVGKEMLTPEEAARYMGISLSHLYKLTSANLLTKYKPSGKLMFLSKEEINHWMKQNEILSDEDLDNLCNKKVENYNRNRKSSKL